MQYWKNLTRFQFFFQAYDASAIFEAAQGRLQGGSLLLGTNVTVILNSFYKLYLALLLSGYPKEGAF